MLGRLAVRSLAPWLIGGVVSAAIAGGGWLWHGWETGKLEDRIAELEASQRDLRSNRDRWKAQAEELELQMEIEREQRRQAEVAVQDLLLELGIVRDQAETLTTAIDRAPPSEDGPVAPVLRKTLEGLAR